MYSLVIHGGAGDLTKSAIKRINVETNKINLEKEYKNALEECCKIGENILRRRGCATDAVLECIKYMENNELFNAGKGSSANYKNKFRLEATIMDGREGDYGSCTLINKVKNPICLAEKIMNSDNTAKFIGGSKATQRLAKKYKLETVSSRYYKSSYRTKLNNINKDHNYGTVGAVAMDVNGNIVAGTSTGGLFEKEKGRIGDTPIVNISTFADNKIGGLSLTGKGEYIMKKAVAYDIIARMKYRKISMTKAVEETLKTLDKNNVGIIGIDAKNGNTIMKFNTKRMFRGSVVNNKKSIKQCTATVSNTNNINIEIW
jgi:L-asparaginase / beta-aspartyl-peptidase